MSGGEYINKERWIVSYADFVTLLFAFFVVMYAISSVNTGKYRVLADALEESFSEPLKSIDPIQLGELARFLSNYDVESEDAPINQTINNPQAEENFSEEIPLELLAEEIRPFFKGLIKQGQVELRQQEDWVEVEISSQVLFDTGGAFLKPDAQIIIRDIAEILKKFPNPITVEGFTDNVPIQNALYPSNWELSADRATTFVRELISNGVLANRLSAMGYGENFPIGNNATLEGRKKNRRVIILIQKDSTRRAYLRKLEFQRKLQAEKAQQEEAQQQQTEAAQQGEEPQLQQQAPLVEELPVPDEILNQLTPVDDEENISADIPITRELLKITPDGVFEVVNESE